MRNNVRQGRGVTRSWNPGVWATTTINLTLANMTEKLWMLALPRFVREVMQKIVDGESFGKLSDRQD